MSLSGKIETMPLPDILQFIGLGRKTGVLKVASSRFEKELFFEEGLAVWCSSNNPKEYLGQHLLARTSLTEADLEEAFRRQRNQGRPLGEVLVESGKITAAELDKVLRRKIEDSMYELFTWTSGDFSFDEGELEESRVPLRVRLSWETLVMEGAWRSDELARVRELIPNDSLRLRAVHERFPAGFPRSGGDRKLVALIEKGLRVDQILPRFHLSDFDILNRLGELCRERLLDVIAGSEQVETGGAGRNELLSEGSRLLSQGRFPDALERLRSGTQRFPADRSFAEALAAAETQLRERYAEADSMVPCLSVPLEELTTLELDSRQGFVVSRVNGQWDLRSITQICPFDEVDVLSIFAELERRGLVEVQAPVGAGRRELSR